MKNLVSLWAKERSHKKFQRRKQITECWKRQSGWNKVIGKQRSVYEYVKWGIKSYRNLQVCERILDFTLGDMGSGVGDFKWMTDKM